MKLRNETLSIVQTVDFIEDLQYELTINVLWSRPELNFIQRLVAQI